MRKNLKDARIKKGLTQQALAVHLNISERMYKFIESGDRTGSIEIWDKLEDLFNVHQRILRENFDQANNQ